ncbi:hypothetical protein ACFE04_021825 [Oxalis oulophora]
MTTSIEDSPHHQENVGDDYVIVTTDVEDDDHGEISQPAQPPLKNKKKANVGPKIKKMKKVRTKAKVIDLDEEEDENKSKEKKKTRKLRSECWKHFIRLNPKYAKLNMSNGKVPHAAGSKAFRRIAHDMDSSFDDDCDNDMSSEWLFIIDGLHFD